jgi:poly(beta-D-mannuronate) lyase
MRKILFLSTLFLLFISNGNAQKNSSIVKNQAELKAAIQTAKPGAEIIMANGVWNDIQIKFAASGTKEAPITLKAETAGKVFIEGVSNLKLSGKYLVVNGLFFRNGHTPKNAVIDFHINKDSIAYHSKVTHCVIDNFNQPNRVDEDHWVEFWGRHNELDHCNIIGKSNQGPTVMVILKGIEHSNNYHQITNNYFGPRPRKGGPHGETIQLGDSGTSMVNSYSNVANNFFDRCDGEVEIISNKSNLNSYKNNIFYHSEGSLVMRHGNYCTVDGNIFIGDGKSEAIGGIRIINTGHWVTNNYFYNIIGKEFRSAIAVMNGIPKAAQNRYNQVTDAVVAYNTFVDCVSPWQFSVGANLSQKEVLPASELRSARPTRTTFANNIIYNHLKNDQPIVAYDKVDGVDFENNLINSENNSEVKSEGIKTVDFDLQKISEWLYAPRENDNQVYSGFDFDTINNDIFGTKRLDASAKGAIVLPIDQTNGNINKAKYGATWYEAKTAEPTKTIQITNSKALIAALANTSDNTTLVLKKGIYKIPTTIKISKNITITSNAGKSKAVLQYVGASHTAAFTMLPFGRLTLDNIDLKGTGTQTAINTLEKGMATAFNLFITNSSISNFETVLYTYKDAFADQITVSNCSISDCDQGFILNTETDDFGDYNVEFLTVTDSNFNNIQKSILNYYRGGYDESTVGGTLVFTNNKVMNSGKIAEDSLLIKNRGIVNVTIENNDFENNPVKVIAILWGEKKQEPKNNLIKDSGEFMIQQNLKMKMIY